MKNLFFVLLLIMPLNSALNSASNSEIKSSWWQNTNVYQIYIRSFEDTNNDGVGDIKGIINKLPYLADLGVETLWLSPIHPSPNKDFGYDVADYYGIHPDFGNMQDFENLISEAKKLNIKIILDLVVNHTSTEHPWFQESKSSEDNPKRDWYVWSKVKNNWQARFGLSQSAWEYDKTTDSHYLRNFTKEQADLNWNNREVREEVYKIMRFWLDKGVKGFRLDVCNYYMKDELLRDNPQKGLIDIFSGTNKKQELEYYMGYPYNLQTHLHDKDNLEALKLRFEEMRSIVDGYDAFLLGEIDSEDLNSELSAWAYGEDFTGLSLSLNKHLTDLADKNQDWNAGKFKKIISTWLNLLPDNAWPVYNFNNHDVIRVLSRFGNNIDKAKSMATLLLTLRGTPVMYYGEEIGMNEVDVPNSERLDCVHFVFSNMFHTEPGRDGCRTPMQWDSSDNAGFSQTQDKTWLPVDKNYENNNVENLSSESNQTSIFHTYKNLLALRKKYPVLQSGTQDFLELENSNPNILAYKRYDKNHTAYVLINMSDAEIKLGKLNLDFEENLITSFDAKTNLLDVEFKEANIAPNSAKVFIFRK